MKETQQQLLQGIVIPAHPLALDADRKLDERRQRALTRYHSDAGAGGIAVGVQTTQFAIVERRNRRFEKLNLPAKFFDARNNFAGCIAGLHEVLRRQGLMAGRWGLDPQEDLSPGQLAEIDRVYQAYPHLNDDEFVRQNLDQWLR